MSSHLLLIKNQLLRMCTEHYSCYESDGSNMFHTIMQHLNTHELLVNRWAISANNTCYHTLFISHLASSRETLKQWTSVHGYCKAVQTPLIQYHNSSESFWTSCVKYICTRVLQLGLVPLACSKKWGASHRSMYSGATTSRIIKIVYELVRDNSTDPAALVCDLATFC